MKTLLWLFLLVIIGSQSLLPTSALRVAFWTGYAGDWSGNDFDNGSVYGSELALLNVAEHLGATRENYTIDVYVLKDVDYALRGIRWCHQKLLYDAEKYDVMVVSRYANYFIYHDARSIANRTYVWIHDVGPQASYDFKQLSDNAIPFVKNVDPIVDGYIAVSETHKRVLVEFHGMDFEKVAVIPNAISTRDVELVTSSESSRVTNSFVFASAPDRSLDLVLTMFPKVTHALPNATLSIYHSHSEDKRLQQLVNEQPNVNWIGRVSHDELMKIWAKADYWLYPTAFFETCCTTTMESAMGGALHITSTTGAVGENSQGVAIPGDPQDLPAFTQQVLDTLRMWDASPETKEEQREKQRKWAQQQQWGQRAEMFLELIESQAYTKDITSSYGVTYKEPEGRWIGASLLKAKHGDAQNPIPIDSTNPYNWHWYKPPSTGGGNREEL